MDFALKYHRTHLNKKLRFHDRPYQRAIYKDDSRCITVIKSTQNGISEYLICRSIFETITKHDNCLFVLPTDLVKTRYVMSRFNKSIIHTAHYKNNLKKTDSVSLKEFQGIINFVGSNSPGNFTEFVARIVKIAREYGRDVANPAEAREILSIK